MDSELTWEELEAQLQGSVVMVGLTFVDVEDQLVEQFQTHGTFVGFSEEGLMMLKQPNGKLFKLPYDLESITAADPGEYTERSTGIIVENPDFLVRWTIRVSDNDSLAEIKQFGFYPPNE